MLVGAGRCWSMVVPPALWATGGLVMSPFPLSRQAIQPLLPLLGGGVFPLPLPPSPGPGRGGREVAEGPFSLLGRVFFDTPHRDRGPPRGDGTVRPPSFDRPHPRWLQEALEVSQEASKRAPRAPQEAPRWPQDGPIGLQDGSRRAQRLLKRPPRRPRWPPRRPRWAQESPRWPQDVSKSAQEAT